jgi:DDE family transposase
LKVIGRSGIQKVEVRADGTGLSSRAGTALLALAAERVGLTDALGWALGETRERRSAHDPGRVFGDLAVMLADGGRCVSDLIALARSRCCSAAWRRSRRRGGCCCRSARPSSIACARRARRRERVRGRRARRPGR